MPHFSNTGSELFLCQLCTKTIDSATDKGAWLMLPRGSEGTVCTPCATLLKNQQASKPVERRERTDCHRPSAFIPADYEYVAADYIKCNTLGDCAFLREQRKRLADHMARTGGKRSTHDHGGACHVCGNANAIYLLTFYHAKTNTYVKLGHDCAVKVEISTGDFNAFKRNVTDARKNVAGNKKAEATLNDLGLAYAWTLYHTDANAVEISRDGAIIRDMVGKLVKYGSLSEKQTAFLRSLVTREIERPEREARIAAERAAEAATAADVIEGRYEIYGEVLTVKTHDSQFGTCLKMLVKSQHGFKVWGTVPRSAEASVERGRVVRFEATVKKSDNDPKFGFFSRPRLVEAA